MVKYLTLEQVLNIHDFVVEKFGGSHGVRDLGLVESALARPGAGFGDFEAYPDLLIKSAVLAHSLLKNHPFIDGNKRTAMMAMEQFLYTNGLTITAKKGEIYQLALDIENNTFDETGISKWLEQHTEPVLK